MQRVVRERIVRKCAEQVPTTWLDDLLTGPNAVLKGNGGTWGCPEIEALLKAIKSRILALSNEKGQPRAVERGGKERWAREVRA